jgi:hypothetical protein
MQPNLDYKLPEMYFALYLKYILDVFRNAKKIELNLCVYLHVLFVHKVVLRKKLTCHMVYVKKQN